jgi:cyclopropane-fatty-acyl-phospholipid synthase
MSALENTLLLPAGACSSSASVMPRNAKAVLGLFDRIAHGALEIRLPDGAHLRFGESGQAAPALLEIGNWSVFDSVLARGDVGFAEAWIDGQWHSPDLTALLTLLANNRELISRAVYGPECVKTREFTQA